MSLLVPQPSARLTLLRFAVRALRITASTVAVVALLRQQWLAGSAWALAWLLIAAAPLVFRQLEPDGSAPGDPEPPSR